MKIYLETVKTHLNKTYVNSKAMVKNLTEFTWGSSFGETDYWPYDSLSELHNNSQLLLKNWIPRNTDKSLSYFPFLKVSVHG